MLFLIITPIVRYYCDWPVGTVCRVDCRYLIALSMSYLTILAKYEKSFGNLIIQYIYVISINPYIIASVFIVMSPFIIMRTKKFQFVVFDKYMQH